jgi:sugar phosphate isomerase/epimerase
MTGYDLGPDDLIAAYYTLAHVDRHGTARTPFPERVAAASAAGFRGIGIQPHDHARSRDAGFSDAEMHELLDHHGVVLGEVDGVPWWPDASAAGSFEGAQREALVLGEEFGAHHGVAPCPLGPLGSTDEVVERFAAACDLASAHGLRLGLEFLPWAPIRTLGQAWEIVRLADRPNGGLTFDFWHYTAGGFDDELLRSIPGDKIHAIHFTDGHRDPSLDAFAETMVGRRLPGEGEFPIGHLVRVLDEIGARTPMTVELVSIPHRHLPTADYARLVYDSVRAAVEDARNGSADVSVG